MATSCVYELWRVSSRTNPSKQPSSKIPENFPEKHEPSHSLYTLLCFSADTFCLSRKICRSVILSAIVEIRRILIFRYDFHVASLKSKFNVSCPFRVFYFATMEIRRSLFLRSVSLFTIVEIRRILISVIDFQTLFMIKINNSRFQIPFGFEISVESFFG